MEIAYTVFAFIFGLVFGSFYNVVGLRVPKKESIVSPPSHCTNCNRQLTALDLIPVFSYVFLGGYLTVAGGVLGAVSQLTVVDGVNTDDSG